ncbi:MAG TPA: ATP-binding protein [Candidatus Dormibacteraeota bacterium]|nr:ATP-binding protein [Candidatus Dormibacteraeota bacterium]
MRIGARAQAAATLLAAVAAPAVLTAALVWIGGKQRDYVFLYLAVVAVLGVLRGLWPALAAAAVSFVLVDYFFVPPLGTYTIASELDIVNLLAFMATAGLVGLLAARRRAALVRAEALAVQLRRANAEQAEAARQALRLARSEERVRALEETDRLRRDLLNTVSHELRTPLGTILTESTDLLPPAAGSEAARRLGTIAAEARRLNALVDDLLDVAVIEAGTLELDLEPMRIGDAIEAAVERLHRRSPGRAVRWDAEAAQVEAVADWDRLGQVFDNLLANADRFSPPGAPIRIDASGDGERLVWVRVSDSGPGVAPELRERVFDRFVRGELGPAGTGLGLAIVKGLVEAHGGTIEVGEGEGGGAAFRFTLPRERPAG